MNLGKLVFVLVGASAIAFGQAGNPVTVKSSPASDALVSAAKEMTDEKKSYDTALGQARTTLESSQKTLGEQLQAAQKDLNEKLKADKHYSPALANIETLQKQLAELQSQAQQKFSQASGPISNKISTDKALISGLIPIVRKENNLPDTTTFDPATQKWTEAKK